jgi:tetratricopeptide (TPR) repeat protein
VLARAWNYLYGYERLRHRGDRLFLAGELDRARHEYARARSVLGARDYRSTTIDALIHQCDTLAREAGGSMALPSPVPVAEPLARADEEPFHPGLDDLFELAIGDKDTGRIDAYRALNDEFKAGYVALVQGDAVRAAAYLASAADSPAASFVVQLELGRARSLAGEMGLAREALKLAHGAAPTDIEVLVLLSAVNIELGHYGEARERLVSVAESEGDDPDVIFLLGRALVGLKQEDAALEKFRETVANEPNFHEAYFEAALLLGHDREAQFRLLNRACALAPDEVRYNRELARLVLAETFDEETGLAACDRLMVTDEGNAWEYLYWIAQLYIRRGWKREARDPLQKALRLVPPERSADRRAIEACLRQEASG